MCIEIGAGTYANKQRKTPFAEFSFKTLHIVLHAAHVAASISDMDDRSDTFEPIFRFGMRVRRLRKERRLTQEQLGCKIGLSRSRISRLESGRANASLGTIMRLARGLGMTPSELLVGIGIDVSKNAARESVPITLSMVRQGRAVRYEVVRIVEER